MNRLLLPCLLFPSLCITALLMSCSDGGLIGTSTGPTRDSVYVMRTLPDKISPTLPGSVVDEAKITVLPSTTVSADNTSFIKKRADLGIDRRKQGRADEISSTWQILVEYVTQIEALRLEIQKVLSLSDSVFDQIQTRCEQQNDPECVLPSGSLTAEYTEEIVNRLIKLNSDAIVEASADVAASEQYLATTVDEIRQLVGKTVTFGELRFEKLSGNPYDFQLSSTATDLFFDEVFTIRWRADKSAIEFVIGNRGSNLSDFTSYSYQSGIPSERIVVHQRYIIDTGQLLSDFSIVGTDETTGRALLEARIDLQEPNDNFKLTVQGQLGHSGGFTDQRLFLEPDENEVSTVQYLKESFDANGVLQSASVCIEPRFESFCSFDANFQDIFGNEGGINQSDFFFEPDGFEQLEATYNESRWEVQQLPAEVTEFIVVTSDTSLALAQRPPLCFGNQYQPGFVALFCAGSDEQLATAQVVQIFADGRLQLVPQARVVLSP